jgi:hypothetical protein
MDEHKFFALATIFMTARIKSKEFYFGLEKYINVKLQVNSITAAICTK